MISMFIQFKLTTSLQQVDSLRSSRYMGFNVMQCQQMLRTSLRHGERTILRERNTYYRICGLSIKIDIDRVN